MAPDMLALLTKEETKGLRTEGEGGGSGRLSASGSESKDEDVASDDDEDVKENDEGDGAADGPSAILTGKIDLRAEGMEFIDAKKLDLQDKINTTTTTITTKKIATRIIFKNRIGTHK